MTDAEPTTEPTPEVTELKFPVPKGGGRIKTIEDKVDKLREDLDEVRWCFAELMFKAKQSAAKQVLEQPAVREKLEAMIMAQMDQAGTTGTTVTTSQG